MQYDDNAEKYGYEGEMTPLKCDELKDRWFWAYPTESVDCDGITGSAHEVYSKSEVDAAIAELKDAWRSEHEACEALKAKLETVNELVKTSKDLYDHSIESLKATHDTEMVDAGMRERRLKRALWFARALRARDIQRYWIAATCAPITERACRVWNNVEIKCLKKAEEHK